MSALTKQQAIEQSRALGAELSDIIAQLTGAIKSKKADTAKHSMFLAYSQPLAWVFKYPEHSATARAILQGAELTAPAIVEALENANVHTKKIYELASDKGARVTFAMFKKTLETLNLDTVRIFTGIMENPNKKERAPTVSPFEKLIAQIKANTLDIDKLTQLKSALGFYDTVTD
jgi:hypothetical protein